MDERNYYVDDDGHFIVHHRHFGPKPGTVGLSSPYKSNYDPNGCNIRQPKCRSRRLGYEACSCEYDREEPERRHRYQDENRAWKLMALELELGNVRGTIQRLQREAESLEKQIAAEKDEKP